MNNGSDVPAERRDVQEAFWTGVDQVVQRMVTDVLEQTLKLEQEARLGAAWNQRSTGRRGYRNGHYVRRLSTPHGPLRVCVPRCRDGGIDCSMIFDRYQRRIADVDRILTHAYLLGASTRGTAELAEQIFGGRLSHQTVSRLTRWLDDHLIAYRRQPIAPWYPVVHLDGMHLNMRGQDRMVMLVMGVREDGVKQMLGFCLSTGEQCSDLLWDLRKRGLEGVEMFVSDDSGAIRSAVAEVYPEVPWQSCSLHKLMALRETIGPTEYRGAMVRQAARIFHCPSKTAAVDAAIAWATHWKQTDPWAVRHFMDGLSDSLTFYCLPKTWWRRTRTNNTLERTIRTLRIRLRPMGCFYNEPAIERAVLGQLARWHLIPKLTHNT